MNRIWTPILLIFLFMIGVSFGTSEERMVVKANDILTSIENDLPVDFDNCIVVGNLNLSEINIYKKVHFNNTIFENSVNCYATTFDDAAYFESSNFLEEARFSFSIFRGPADFMYSSFKRDAYFESSDFKNDANFYSSKFREGAFFRSIDFNGTANFASSIFNGTASFISSTFNRDSYFESSNFNGIADFWKSVFNGPAKFAGSIFNETADFMSSTFKNDADFKLSNFSGMANFRSSRFNSSVDFMFSNFEVTDYTGTQFYKDSNFEDCQFEGSASFNRSHFMGDVLFQNATFRKVLFLTRTEYNKLFIRWNDINKNGELGYDDTAYLLLINNFKTLGLMEDAANCYYSYRVNSLARYHSSVKKFFHSFEAVFGLSYGLIAILADFIQGILYGWGTRPAYIFFWSFIVIVFFWIFWQSMPKKVRMHFEGGTLAYSATIFLSGYGLDYLTRYFFKTPKIPPRAPGILGSLTKCMFILERILGSLFSFLLIFTIGRMILW